MTGTTNEAEIAAVTDVARVYYEGMIAGDEKLLTGIFHPRAAIVGNNRGQLEWQTLEEFIQECKDGAEETTPRAWRLDGFSMEGDTALLRVRGLYQGDWYSDDLSLLRIDGAWRIVHKTWYVHPSAPG